MTSPTNIQTILFDYLFIEILGIIVLVLCVVVFFQYVHYCRIIKKKNKGLVQHIFAQKELEKKIEQDEVEKKMMERVLQEKFEILIVGREKK